MEQSSLLSLKRSPQKGSRYHRCYQAIRWKYCTPYHALFALVSIANIIPLIFVIVHLSKTERPANSKVRPELTDILTAVSINLTASIAIRNEHVINMLFRIFVVHVSPRWPLRLRCVFAKVYYFGGVHSGCGVAAVAWYAVYTGFSMHDFIDSENSRSNIANMCLTAIVWLLMCSVVFAATPHIRAHMHNCFEATHRFCGWSILVLFWVQTLLFCILSAGSKAGVTMIRIPTFWALIAMSIAVLYPWIRMRHVKVRWEALSGHAVRMYVDDGKIMPPCRVVAISDSPLKETHKFATIPEPEGRLGYSMVISDAGDWTARIIRNPPEKMWIKGAPAWGVLRIATMFQPVVIVVTGSGIGPCLGLFNGCPQLKCRVLWRARKPMITYGADIVEAVKRADKDAWILDSSDRNRRGQDMPTMALEFFGECKAEAAIVISNHQLTFQIVQRLKENNIRAFGPIWDS